MKLNDSDLIKGGEFKSHEFADYLKSKGIFHKTSAPYISAQNGCVERINHTLKEKAEAMRHQAGLPRNWWCFAIETAMHIYNQTPIEGLKWITPVQAMLDKIPNVEYFRTFGCLAWVWLPDAIRKDKLYLKAEAMTFIGYIRGTKGWLFMRKDNSLFTGSNAKFNELHFPRRENNKEPSPPGIK